MADYYTLSQLSLKLGISEAQIAELELKDLLHAKLKGGRRFFSSRRAHDLQLVLRLARKQRVSLDRRSRASNSRLKKRPPGDVKQPDSCLRCGLSRVGSLH